MTVSSTNSRNDYTVGAAASYPYTFRIFKSTDLVLTVRSADGTETRLAPGADFTVAGAGSKNGGSITLTRPAAYAGYALAIRRVLPTAQETAFRNQGAFFAESHEDAFDRLAMVDQQHEESLGRALRAGETDAETDLTLPAREQRSNRLLGFDANGKPVAVAPVSQSATALQTQLVGNAGASLVGFLQAGVGAVLRTIQAKLRERPSVTDYQSPALADASAQGALLAPSGTHVSTVANGAALASVYYGPGQVRTADGNKRGKFFSSVNAAPASGNESSVDTAFNGDWSRQHFSIEHRITGAATLGQPAAGYLYKPEAMPNYTYMYNESGWNQSAAGNGGRTGVAAYRAKVDQYGQGDAVAFNGSVFVTGTKAGATHWLANPAGVLFNGDMLAGAHGVYLNPYETICDDGGYDVACIGLVNNFKRTNAAGALSTFWGGYRAQNVGSAACDAIVSGVGKWQTGLDFSMPNLDFGANRAAVSLKANQRIYLNNAAIASGNLAGDWRATVFNGDWLGYDTSINGTIVAAGGDAVLQVTKAQTTVTNTFKHTGAAFGVLGADPVAKLGGWGTPTSNSVIANFNGATATQAQCAAAISQIITYMKQAGFFGA